MEAAKAYPVWGLHPVTCFDGLFGLLSRSKGVNFAPQHWAYFGSWDTPNAPPHVSGRVFGIAAARILCFEFPA